MLLSFRWVVHQKEQRLPISKHSYHSSLLSVEQVTNLIVTNFLSVHQWAAGIEPRCSRIPHFQVSLFSSIGFSIAANSHILSDNTNPVAVWLLVIYFDVLFCRLKWLLCYSISSWLTAQSSACSLFQSSFLQALSNQLLCIICLKETGSMPSAWCYHRADMARLAPPPLLWHKSLSVELKAASRPFRSPIIDQEWQQICTALNVIYIQYVNMGLIINTAVASFLQIKESLMRNLPKKMY